MTAPWVAALVSLWVVVVALTVVVAGVLRRVAAALDALPTAAPAGQQMVMGPAPGSALPPIELARADGRRVSLANLPGPLVLAVLTSHCAPCLSIAERLRAEPATLAQLQGLVVVTDPEGPERLGLDDPVMVLVDASNELLPALQVPGTPFVIAIGADRRVESARFLSGVEQLVDLLDAARHPKLAIARPTPSSTLRTTEPLPANEDASALGRQTTL